MDIVWCRTGVSGKEKGVAKAHQKEHCHSEICFAWRPITKRWKCKKIYQTVYILKDKNKIYIFSKKRTKFILILFLGPYQCLLDKCVLHQGDVCKKIKCILLVTIIYCLLSTVYLTYSPVYHIPSCVYHIPSTFYHLPSTFYHLSSTVGSINGKGLSKAHQKNTAM